MCTILKAHNINSLDSKTISSLKNLAFLFMLIDHIGVILYPDIVAFRIIGRLAFPIFAFITMYNFYFNVLDKVAHILNILLIALISQYAFIYAFDFGLDVLNIFFTFFLAMITIYNLEYVSNRYQVFLVLVLSLIFSYFVEYSTFGFFYLIFLYLFISSRLNIYNLLILLLFSFLLNGFTSIFYNLTSLITTIILINIFITNKQVHILSYRFHKLIYYVFYPLHLVVLGSITLI